MKNQRVDSFQYRDSGFTEEKKKKMKKNMIRIVKSRGMSRLSRKVLDASTMFLGIWIARYWSVSDLRLVLKPSAGILAEFGSVLYADHVRSYP